MVGNDRRACRVGRKTVHRRLSQSALLLGILALTSAVMGEMPNRDLSIRSADSRAFPAIKLTLTNDSWGSSRRVWGMGVDQIQCRIADRDCRIASLRPSAAGKDAVAVAVVLDTSGSIGKGEKRRWRDLTRDIAARLSPDDLLGVYVTSARPGETMGMAAVEGFPADGANRLPMVGAR